MSGLDVVDRCWRLIGQLGVEAENGADVGKALEITVMAAIELCAVNDEASTQLATMVNDLHLTAEAFREQRPVYALVLWRAAMLATKASTATS